MTKLQILSAQIQTDLNKISENIMKGMTAEEVIKEIKRVNEKVKKWSDEADKIMNEAEAIDGLANNGGKET